MLILGDCLIELPKVADCSVDLIIGDLPYNKFEAKWDEIIPMDKIWPEFKRICKPTSTVILFGSQPFTSYLVASNYKGFKHSWVWEKDKGANFAQVKRSPMKEHEDILVFCPNKQIQYFPIMETRRGNGINAIGKEYIPNLNPKTDNVMGPRLKEGKPSIVKELRYPRSIQRFNRETGLHPTQKPVTLLEYLIKTYSQENQLVLDPTAGSCSTAIAAMKLNRQWLCIEQDENFYQIGLSRINTL